MLRREGINPSPTGRFRGCFYIRILVQGQGGTEFSATGILVYFEDWKRGPDAEMGRKDNFEMAFGHIGKLRLQDMECPT
jgi:hypothetical protein